MARWCLAMDSNEMSCGPWVTPNMKPLSWLGMKPVGMLKKRYTVPTSIRMATASVIGLKRRAILSVTSYQRNSRSKPPSSAR